MRNALLGLAALGFSACEEPARTPAGEPVNIDVAVVTEKMREKTDFDYSSCGSSINRVPGESGLPKILMKSNGRTKQCGIQSGIDVLREKGLHEVSCDDLRPRSLEMDPALSEGINLCRHAILCFSDDSDNRQALLDVWYQVNSEGGFDSGSNASFYYSPSSERVFPATDPLPAESLKCFPSQKVQDFIEKGLTDTSPGWIVSEPK
ncbi:MAG: hypothetical protein WC882_01695 [Candidatus Gracilibacteria bacterium]